MADVKWVSEDDDYWKEVHTAKVSNFDLVIRRYSNDSFDWFVNVLDDNGDILWHSLIEGTEASLAKCKKDVIEAMNALAANFKSYRRETK